MEHTSGIDDDGLPGHRLGAAHRDRHVGAVVLVRRLLQERTGRGALDLLGPQIGRRARALQRSEEHTSELQSRQYLVCRLLLGKKKRKNTRLDASHAKNTHAELYL